MVKYAALLNAGIRRQDVKVVVLRDLLRNEDHAIAVARIEGKWIVLDNRWLALVHDIELRMWSRCSFWTTQVSEHLSRN